MRTELVLQALNMALQQRSPTEVVHHSDQGYQYCFDNAICESFFATLECERLACRRFKTQSEVRMAVFEFFEGW